jgi:DNA-binding MarR family transcriptional regulator
VSNDEQTIVSEILALSERIFALLPVIVPSEWFTSDLTVAQLRILLLLQTHGSARMGAIASGLDITLPTATGIVDNLVKKGLVSRDTDMQDRRLVICRLSEAGQMLINMIWILGQGQMKKLLDGLTPAQLEKCKEVADILYENISHQPKKAEGPEQA